MDRRSLQHASPSFRGRAQVTGSLRSRLLRRYRNGARCVIVASRLYGRKSSLYEAIRGFETGPDGIGVRATRCSISTRREHRVVTTSESLTIARVLKGRQDQEVVETRTEPSTESGQLQSSTLAVLYAPSRADGAWPGRHRARPPRSRELRHRWPGPAPSCRVAWQSRSSSAQLSVDSR